MTLPSRPRNRRRAVRAVLAGLAVASGLATAPPAAADPKVEAVATANRRSAREVERILADPAARVDAGNRIFYADTLEGELEPAGEPPAAATYPYDATFRLHSRPGSSRVIYLDFDGHTVTNTGWNSYAASPVIVAEPFTMDGSPTFTTAEQDVVQSVWQRVAEDFAPFDVDVTTEDPGDAAITRSGTEDPSYGTRALITANQTVANVCGCLGVAYLGAFSEPYSHSAFQPAFVFSGKLGNRAKAIGDATSHEVGHNLNLFHDGGGGGAYYQGHDRWAPIMGFPIDRPITQWSKGEYAGATNTQDDLATIAGSGAPLLPDDHGDTAGTATPTDGRGTITGLISSDADVDAFSVRAGAGGATFTVDPAQTSPNLDVRLELRSAGGSVLASDDPPSTMLSDDLASGMAASVSLTVPAGDHVVLVSGVGSGSASTGYTGYGSVGRYTLTSRVNQPAVHVTSSQNPSLHGQPVTFQAAVSVPPPGLATGTITFRDGAALLCRDVPLNGGRASCSWPVGAGRHPITAVYSGDATYSQSSSAVLEQVVDGDDTTVSLAAAGPTVADMAATFRATVRPQPPVTDAPPGTVTFRDGGTVLCADAPLAGGAATCSRPLAAGTHTITAEYGGSFHFDGSTSPPLDHAVGRAAPAVTVSTSRNPVPFDTYFLLSASVASEGAGTLVPTGTVDIMDGDKVLCSGLRLSRGATPWCESWGLPIGDHLLTAVYHGDSNFTGRVSPAFTQVVTRKPVEFQVRTTPNVSPSGESVTLVAELGPAPWSGDWTGTVTFFDGGVPVCVKTAPAYGANVTCSLPLFTGHHTITVQYSGDALRLPGTSNPYLHVVGLAAARVDLTTSTTQTTPGGLVSLAASVSPVLATTGVPTGTVTFRDGDVPVCAEVPLVAGQASCRIGFPAGNRPLTAVYSGNAAFAMAVSSTETVLVEGTPVTVSLVSSTNPAVRGQPVSVTATVQLPPGSGAASGTLSFYRRNERLCAFVPIVAGQATCVVRPFVGTTLLTAVYSGDDRFSAATSPTVPQVVTKAATTVAITTPPGAVRAAGGVSLSASVSVVAPGAASLWATLSFFVDGSHVCNVTVSSSSTSCSVPVTPGSHRITATFWGNDETLRSDAAPVDITVLPEGDELVPVTPNRLLDTRVGIGGPAIPLGLGTTRDVVVRGGATGIPDHATAVVLNTTATAGSAASTLTVWQAGATRPGASNLAFAPGQTIPNLVTVAVGAGGRVSVHNAAGHVHAILDVVGYYTLSGGATFTSVTPSRLLDSRIGTGGPAAAFGPGVTRDVVVRGATTGIPDTATAVVLNTTAVTPTASSYLTVYPAGGARPNASNLNFVAGQTIPNLVVVGVGAGGRISIFNAVGSVHVLADVVGYYGPGGTRFTPIAPFRAYDTTREFTIAGTGRPFGPGEARTLQVSDVSRPVPPRAKALVLNVTVGFATEPSYLTVHPAGVARPVASNLNFVRGELIANQVVVGLSPSGAVTLFNAAGSVHVVVDVVGYMS